MSAPHFDVLGIGNAIVDILARCDDAFLDSQGLPKGHMQLIGADEADRLYREMGSAIEISGGSAANSMAGIASFGGKAAFIGRVADDQFGRVFAHDIRSIGVAYDTPAAEDGAPTARCLILVTPDGERTMNTYLGASVELGNGEVNANAIADARILYLEGYLYDPPEAKAAFHEAADHAKAAGRKVALSLSDSFCVERHREAFHSFIRTHVDILFANDEEIRALYETDSFDAACSSASKDCPLAALTRGAKGSVIVSKDGVVEIPAEAIDKLVDTTGAGDLYASGFLFGVAQDLPLSTCGALASLAAAEIISHIGARPEQDLSTLAESRNLLNGSP
ncbi:MAG: adenosine kinase [Methyloligellaceae bacterium]